MSSQLNPDLEKLNAKQLPLFDRIFRDQQGRIVIGQIPNLPVLVGSIAIVLHFILPPTTPGNIQALSGLIGFGALFTWAWQELFSGVNYFRRSLGLIGLVSLLAFGLYLN